MADTITDSPKNNTLSDDANFDEFLKICIEDWENRPIELSVFESVNTKAKSKTIGWNDFIAMVENPSIGDKRKAQLITPHNSTAKTGAAATKAEFSIVVIDYDNGAETFDKVFGYWQKQNVRAAMFTTSSHTIEEPRFKVVLRLFEPIDADEWYELANGLTILQGADPAQARASQGFFAPNKLTDSSEYRYEVLEGESFSRSCSLWNEAIAAFEQQRSEAEAKATPKPRKADPHASNIVGLINDAYDIRVTLKSSGLYERRGKKYLFKKSESRVPGVRILQRDGKEVVYSHHSKTDPLSALNHKGHSLDCADVLCALEYDNDFKAMIKAEADKLDPEGQKKRQREYMAERAGELAPYPFPAAEDRPQFIVVDDWVTWEGGKVRPGTYYCGMSKGTKTEIVKPVNTRICNPLHVEANVCDQDEQRNSWLLRFKNDKGNWCTWVAPKELIGDTGADLRKALLDLGVNPDFEKSRQLLPRYLQNADRFQRDWRTLATQTGWIKGAYALPDTAIGPDGDKIIFDDSTLRENHYSVAGTLDGWRDEIAAKATGNPAMILALSAGFVGPLLRLLRIGGGGLHFVGESSTGKSTLLKAAASIWGSPKEGEFMRSWRTTDNGLEGVAASRNDNLLVLDELGQCQSGTTAGQIIYMLGNGEGKQRATRSGYARRVRKWQLFILSSGEKTVESFIGEDGKEAAAGQLIRLLDLQVNTGQYGIWTNLHGLTGDNAGARFSNSISQAALKHHGHAGRAFITRLANDCALRAGLEAEFKRYLAMDEFATEGTDGQPKRAAERLALAALAGELATSIGITGWQAGDAIVAASGFLQPWIEARGTTGNIELQQTIERLTDSFVRYHDIRFISADDGGSEFGRPVYERRGWYRHVLTHGLEYLLSPHTFKELCGSSKHVKDMLVKRGILIPSSNKTAQVVKIEGRSTRVYVIRWIALVPDSSENAHFRRAVTQFPAPVTQFHEEF